MLNLALSLSVVLTSALMTYQDIKYRAISWYAFLFLGVALFFINDDFSQTDFYVNIAFIIINYLLATLIISIRHMRLVNLYKAHIGLGDILLLVCLALYFPPLNFFAFYFSSLVLIALSVGIYIKLKDPQHFTVPLAGLQSCLLICFILLSWVTNVSSANISWLTKYIP